MKDGTMFEQTLQYLDGAPLGLFGVGHLGQTIATGLLAAGFPSAQLIVCHDGSELMVQRMAAAGLTEHVVAPAELAERARILLYLVRPQDRQVLGAYALRSDVLLLSFLAGVLLEDLPVDVPMERRVRLLPSAPATIRDRDGYCGLYPADHEIAGEIIEALGMRVAPMYGQDDFHAFTGWACACPRP
jgi:pyrroline-5-carboxylate reductase